MKNWLFIIVLVSILFSCDIPSRETVDFAFFEIEEMTLDSRFSGFSDVWYSQDGSSQGVFELPRRFPVVAENVIEGVLQAGIRENGINSSPRRYPFTANIDLNLELDKGEVLNLSPDFTYLENVVFRLTADFETENPFGFDEDGVEDLKLIPENGVGKMAVGVGEIIEEASSLVFTDLPQTGSPVYLEIEYRGNRDLDIGLIGIAGDDVFKEYFVSLRSENDWKKAYVNLTELLIASRLPGYQVLLGVDNTNGSNDVEVYVDNVKLLHF